MLRGARCAHKDSPLSGHDQTLTFFDTAGRSILEHRVSADGVLRNFLSHVPVLHDLSLAQAEDVDNGDTATIRLWGLVHVKNDVITVNERLLDLAV